MGTADDVSDSVNDRWLLFTTSRAGKPRRPMQMGREPGITRVGGQDPMTVLVLSTIPPISRPHDASWGSLTCPKRPMKLCA